MLVLIWSARLEMPYLLLQLLVLTLLHDVVELLSGFVLKSAGTIAAGLLVVVDLVVEPGQELLHLFGLNSLHPLVRWVLATGRLHPGDVLPRGS